MSKLSEKQLTKDQAIAFAESGVWKEWTPDQVVSFQLFQELLCIDFGHYHGCVEKVLNRPVFTHEFADQLSLQKEYLGEKEAPSLGDIINLIPADKRIIIGI